MTIYAAGALNLAALIVPDLAVVVLPPDLAEINGVATNVLGVVGSASWGQKNSPVAFSDLAGGSREFGNLNARKYDLMTQVAAARVNGAADFRGIRVTDGTDAAASAVIGANGLTCTSIYTGSKANGDQVRIDAGSQANSYKVTILRADRTPEVFDNVAAGLAANAIWVAIAAAINNGVSGLRGKSELIVATAGASVTAPVAGVTVSLSGGTDGATGVTASHLIGVDTSGARTGMYALRNSGASIALLADLDDSTTWTAQVAFGLAEGIYMIAVAPAGCAIANGTTGVVDLKATAGIDSYAIKILHGDWCYFQDTVNKLTRLISPQGFIAGRLANSSPEVSSLNKPLYGIVGTQKSSANQVYSAAELQQLGAAGVDVITNPVPGGHYFGARFGRNASSRQDIHNDTYTRLTNFIAATLNAGMGQFIGRNQTPDLRLEAKATLDSFCSRLANNGIIGTADGSPAFSNKCDNDNNPPEQVRVGIMQALCRVTHFSVVENFVVSMQGGQTVRVERLSTEAA